MFVFRICYPPILIGIPYRYKRCCSDISEIPIGLLYFECFCMYGTGYNMYKWIKQMIKFSRVCFISSASLCMIRAIVHINKSNKRLRPFPRLKFISLTSGRVWASNKPLTGYPKSNHLDSPSTPKSSPWGRHMVVRTICHVILNRRSKVPTKNSTPWRTLPFSCRTLPSCLISCCSRTFLTGGLSFKGRWRPHHHRNDTSLLRTVLPHGPLIKSPPPTALLSALILPSRAHADPTATKGGEACASHDTPEPRRRIRRLLIHCHVVTQKWMSCITMKQKYDIVVGMQLIHHRVHY